MKAMSAPTVHKKYNEAIFPFRKLIADLPIRNTFAREIDGFMRQTAVGVWGEDGGLSPRHVEYYNAIYCKGGPVPTVLYWDLCSQVSDYPGFQVPAFFEALIRYDQTARRDTHPVHLKLSRRFVDIFTLMMLLFAAVDNIISEREARFISRCADTLAALCDAAGIPSDRAGVNIDDFITPGHPTGKVEDQDAAQEQKETTAEGKAKQDAEEDSSLQALLGQLDELCGLDKVKADVKSLINLVKVRRLREKEGLPVPPMSLHLVFMGNPGTGKTTVARLLAKIYHAIGVLSKGQLVEVDRSGLVAGFVGQTAIKTNEAIEKALGGVLFIDEAYALTSRDSDNDFGQEAVETLLKGMEDNRRDLVVIVAGYTELMEDFIHSNPGLESRFNKYFFFDDYNGAQLMDIFRSLCKKNGYTLDAEAETFCKDAFEKLYAERDENFGNARDVRNVFEQAVARQANRVAALETPTKEELMALTVADLKEPDEEDAAGE